MCYYLAYSDDNYPLGSSHSEEEDDDMNDDAFNDDFRVPSPKGKRRLYEVGYESLSVGAIEEAIRKEADHVVGIFGVDVRPWSLYRLRPDSICSPTRPCSCCAT